MKKMIKTICYILTLALCLALSGCQKEEPFERKDTLYIQDHQWVFSHAMELEGTVVYCAQEQQAQYPNAETLELTCQIQEEKILLKTADQTWELPYSVNMEGSSGTIYNLESNTTALASVNKTTLDGTPQYTLTIAADLYALYFTEQL